VNGKLRDRLMLSKDAAFGSAKVKEHTDGKTIRKIIFVPGKPLKVSKRRAARCSPAPTRPPDAWWTVMPVDPRADGFHHKRQHLA
jgi:hypothetical protein